MCPLYTHVTPIL